MEVKLEYYLQYCFKDWIPFNSMLNLLTSGQLMKTLFVARF